MTYWSFQEIFKKASGPLKGSVQEVEKAGKPVTEMNGDDHSVQSVSSASQRTSVAAMEVDQSKV